MKPKHFDSLTWTAQNRWLEQASGPLNASDKAIVRHLSTAGFHHKRIAALFDVNQGRIRDALKDAKLTVSA